MNNEKTEGAIYYAKEAFDTFLVIVVNDDVYASFFFGSKRKPRREQ